MSHKITSRDIVYLANIPELFNGLGWHKKGTPETVFNEQTLAKILFVHAYANAGILLANGSFHETGERYAIDDTGLPIGPAIGGVFDTPSNLDLFRVFNQALNGSEFEIVSAGTIDGRIEFFVDSKHKNSVRAGGRDVSQYVGLHRSFGGLKSIVVSGHSTVIQCGNTTALFLRESEGKECLKYKNCSANCTPEALEKMKKDIQSAHNANVLFADALEDSASVKVSKDEAREAFLGLLAKVPGKTAESIIQLSTVPVVPVVDAPVSKGKGKKKQIETTEQNFASLLEKPVSAPIEKIDLSTRVGNRANRLLELFAGVNGGAGNVGQTACDWINSVTDYFTHESAGGGNVDHRKPEEILEFRDKQYYSSEFGSARKAKSEFVQTFCRDGSFQRSEFDRVRSIGKYLIENADADFKALLA